MSNGCPNCEALCTICQDNTYNWHESLCNSCRLAVAHTEERIIKLLQDQAVLCGRKGSQGHGLRCALRIVGNGCNCNEVIALIKGEK
jgi:hypothetical protein